MHQFIIAAALLAACQIIVEEASAIYAPIHHRRCAASYRPNHCRRSIGNLCTNSSSPLRC
jgi:hypothetical protein